MSIALGAGLALGATALGAAGGAALVAAQVLAVLAVLNLILGLVNVIPAYPLDGGRIVRAFAWRRTGIERDGWRAAASTGRIVGTLVIVGGAALILVGEVTNGAMVALSGWFLLLSSRAIGERVKVNDLIGDLSVADVMERDAPTVHPGLTVDTFAGQLLDGEVPTTAIAVLRDDEVIGILGVRQVRRLRPGDWATTRVEDVMVRPPRLPMLGPDDGLVSAVEQLQRAGLDGLPVLEDGRLVGVLTRRSIGLAVQARDGCRRTASRRGSTPPRRRRGRARVPRTPDRSAAMSGQASPPARPGSRCARSRRRSRSSSPRSAGPTEAETAWIHDALGRVAAEDALATTDLPPWDNAAMDGYAVRAADIAAATEDHPVAPRGRRRRRRRRRPGRHRAAGYRGPDRDRRPGAGRGGRGRPGGADDAGGSRRAAGRVREDATRPGRSPPDAWSTSRCQWAPRSARPGETCGAGPWSSRPERSSAPRPSPSPPEPAWSTCPSIAGRSSASSRRATSSVAPGGRSAPPGSPMPTDRRSWPWWRTPAATPGTSGSPRDRLDDVKARIHAGLLEGADALIVSGGVSVGPYDHVRAAFGAIGTIDLWRVAVQPGKPFVFGTAERPGGGPRVLLFGLPGNPVSTFVTFELFVRPALRRLSGLARLHRPRDRAVLLDRTPKSAGRRAFVRVVAERDAVGTPIRDDRGRVRVSLAGGAGGQGSHVLSALAAADAPGRDPRDGRRPPRRRRGRALVAGPGLTHGR